MVEYSAAEVEEAFEKTFEEDEYGSDWSEVHYGGLSELELRGEKVPVTLVTSEGGEGEGDVAYLVVKIGEKLFRKDGYYASHDGFYWDGDFREVHAVTRPVTFYE